MPDKVHTADTVKAQLLADIAAANAATGESDETVHDAVARLIAGYGTGGGVSLDSVAVFVGDYYADELTVEIGALDKYDRTIVT